MSMFTTIYKNANTGCQRLPQSTRMGSHPLLILDVNVYHNQQEWIHKPNFKKLTAHLKTFHPGKINLK